MLSCFLDALQILNFIWYLYMEIHGRALYTVRYRIEHKLVPNLVWHEFKQRKNKYI